VLLLLQCNWTIIYIFCNRWRYYHCWFDIGLADGAAAVGELVTVADFNSNAVTNTGGMGDDEGAGVSLSTSFGMQLFQLFIFMTKLLVTNIW
jgi:hypothetical protein